MTTVLDTRTVTLAGVTVRVDTTDDGTEVWVRSPKPSWTAWTSVAVLAFDPSDSVLSALAGAALTAGVVA